MPVFRCSLLQHLHYAPFARRVEELFRHKLHIAEIEHSGNLELHHASRCHEVRDHESYEQNLVTA